jgi:hypothetical protein
VGSGLKTGIRIFYLKVEEGKRKREGLLKTYSTSLTSRFIKFFMFGTNSSTVTIVYEH